MDNYISKSTVDDFLITPISVLRNHEIYFLLKVTVIKKYPIQTWHTKENILRKYFKFNIMDNSGVIHVTAFEDLVDKFFNHIEVLI